MAEEGFASDLAGMEWADACVCVLPCGRSAHLEMGWMLGAGKFGLFLVETREEPELMYKLSNRICVSIDETIDALRDAHTHFTAGQCL
jgi:hypothetical protein